MGWLSRIFGPKVDEVEVSEVRGLLKEGATLIDVREPHEWSDGHIQGARLVPLRKLDGEMAKWPPNRTVLFICQSGGRSARATDRAQQRGLKAINVRGGMIQWARTGLPVKSSRG